MAGTKVLIVEDDETLLEVLRYNFAREGYRVATATDGGAALDVARSERPDLIVLDIMLPGLDGLEVCRILRKETTVPILMLTAKAEEIDKVVGLELGADDYVTKPFSVRELLARVRAMLRRVDMMQQPAAAAEDAVPTIRFGELEIDTARHTVVRGTSSIALSPKEFELLVFLARNKGRVFSRDVLLDRVWGYEYAGDTRTVDVHVRWLRQKIETDPSKPRYLLAVRGVGYKLEE
ncbi:MAG: response regulator transcription factor [Chloroflexota bacterium]|nr:response regulator transcription factor [Chloroflexota bacterium]